MRLCWRFVRAVHNIRCDEGTQMRSRGYPFVMLLTLAILQVPAVAFGNQYTIQVEKSYTGSATGVQVSLTVQY